MTRNTLTPTPATHTSLHPRRARTREGDTPDIRRVALPTSAMSRRMLACIMTLLFPAILLNAMVATAGHAAVVEAISFDTLVARSTSILLVNVTGRETLLPFPSRPNDRDAPHGVIPHTRYRLAVQRAWKGPHNAGNTVHMRTLGGALGSVVTRVSGEPDLRVGSSYLLFASSWKEAKGDLRPVGLAQGVVTVQEQRACPISSQSTFVSRAPFGQLKAAQGAVPFCLALDDLAARIDASLRTQSATGSADQPTSSHAGTDANAASDPDRRESTPDRNTRGAP